jgi:hypothetical protein
MGRAIEVDGARAIGEALAKLTDAVIVMVDNQLVLPTAPPPATWSDIRLKTPAGIFSLKRRGGAVSVVAFGNADDHVIAMQERIAAALRP